MFTKKLNVLDAGSPAVANGGGIFIADRDVIVYKKVAVVQSFDGDYDPADEDATIKEYGIAKLWIPEGTKVFLGETVCRASLVEVLEIIGLQQGKSFDQAWSVYDPDFVYTRFQKAVPTHSFCTKPYTCASGIHFFRTYHEALNY